LIKAEDSTGNQSENPVSIITNIADITKMNLVETSTQDPTFTGVKTNMVVIDSILKLDGVGLFDSEAGLFDSASGFFDSGGGDGFETSGSYEFDTFVDVGKVTTSRVTAIIEGIVIDASQTFDATDGLFDSRQGFFDGEGLDGITVKLFVQTTDDDPSGSPTYDAFRQFFVGDYVARAYKFKIEVTSIASNLNIEISGLRVQVDMPDVVESENQLTSAAGATSIVFSNAFFQTPTIGGTINSGSSGDYIDITAETDAGFDLEAFDDTDTRVARNVRWIAKGF